jgi:hypothetical protein
MPEPQIYRHWNHASRVKFRRGSGRDVTQAAVSPSIPHFHPVLEAVRMTLHIEDRFGPWPLSKGKEKEKDFVCHHYPII